MSVTENIKQAKSRFKWMLKNLCHTELNLKETRILELVAIGLDSKEISDVLCMPWNTVASYRQTIHEKLGSRNAVESVEFGKALKII